MSRRVAFFDGVADGGGDVVGGALRERGLTCVPLKIYFKAGRAKLQIALVKGKKTHDKRESIKKRDVAMEMKKSLQRSRR